MKEIFVFSECGVRCNSLYEKANFIFMTFHYEREKNNYFFPFLSYFLSTVSSAENLGFFYYVYYVILFTVLRFL